MTTRRDTFDEMDRFFDMDRRFFDMNRFFQPFGPRMDFEARREDHQSGAVRMERVEDAYMAIADLPGFEKEEIDLTFDDGILTIAAEHDEHSDTLRRQRRVYERVTVPSEIVREEISATYRNGVLEVTLPLVDVDIDDEMHIDIE